MKKWGIAWLREPLLHFALGGALLFAVHSWLNPSPTAPGSGRQLRIGEGEIQWLASTWQRQYGRKPTPEELRQLVFDLVKEELLAREARAMRLDEDDVIVRRRLAQKLEFTLQGTARLAEPTEEELLRFYRASPKAFLTDSRISFAQVYFSAARREAAAAALPKLVHASPAEAARLGDRLMVETEFEAADRSAVAAAFGPAFASAVFALEPGAWRGPIESGYGVHLVRVTAVLPEQPRDFAEVRPLVVERWREQQARDAEARYLERLMAKYDVRIDAGMR